MKLTPTTRKGIIKTSISSKRPNETDYGYALRVAQTILNDWDLLCDSFDKSLPNYELATGIAANLRGTIKNNSASRVSLSSLANDLDFRISKLLKR